MKLSLVIPVYNEEAVLPITLGRLRPLLKSLGCEYEIVFVNDGSKDGSSELVSSLCSSDPTIKLVSFSRNFGHQAAVTAGLDFATGDAVVVMDSDLQDPPELLAPMLALYREGFDVVSPQRVSRKTDTFFKRKTAALFYKIMSSLVDTAMPAEVGDFRLLSREAVNALRQLREQHRFMRGMVAWLGLREAFVPFERAPRAAGETKYSIWKMIRFSWTAITSFSAMPLRLTLGLGFAAVVLAVGYLIYSLTVALIFHEAVLGWTSLVFLQCFFFGSTLICVGLIGEYIARIYEEAKGRPLYVVNHTRNLIAPTGLPRSVTIPPRQPDAENNAVTEPL